MTIPLSQEEEDFPIGFSIAVHHKVGYKILTLENICNDLLFLLDRKASVTMFTNKMLIMFGSQRDFLPYIHIGAEL